MGCDHVLGSEEKEDKCLRCQNGQNETGLECKQYSGYLRATTIGKSSISEYILLKFALMLCTPTILYFSLT